MGFCAYVIFMLFGLSSVIVGVFVEKTVGVAQSDLKLALQKEVDKVDTFLSHLRKVFHQAGWKHHEVLSGDDFLECLKEANMQLYLNSRGVDLLEAIHIFEMLDENDFCEGGVTVDDFAFGCLERMGPAKCSDVRQLKDTAKTILAVSYRACEASKSTNAHLMEVVKTLQSQLAIVRVQLEELQVKRRGQTA